MILEIEYELWSALIDVAKGMADTVPRTMAALDNVQKILQGQDIEDVSGWFGGKFIAVESVTLLTCK
jgi:hypothetical protein